MNYSSIPHPSIPRTVIARLRRSDIDPRCWDHIDEFTPEEQKAIDLALTRAEARDLALKATSNLAVRIEEFDAG